MHSPWQELADVLEAVLWERARELGRGKRKVDWQAIATQIVDELKTKWPERWMQVSVPFRRGGLPRQFHWDRMSGVLREAF